MPHRQCVCEICANASQTMDAVVSAGVRTGVKDLRQIVNSTLCDRRNIECVKRLCKKCGVKNLKNQWLQMVYPKKKVTWKRWVYIAKEGNKRKLILASLAGTIEQLIGIFASELHGLAMHLMNADWHHGQFSKLIASLPAKVLVEVLDFGQNYLCRYQDEPQPCYWDHPQVTIHPVVCYYRGPTGTPITEELVFV